MDLRQHKIARQDLAQAAAEADRSTTLATIPCAKQRSNG